MLRAAAGCLLAFAIPAAGTGAGDVLSLLQAAVSSQPLQLKSKDKKKSGRHVITWSNGFDGREFTFRRNVSFAEPGSGPMHLFTRGCQAADKYGANDCAMRWGAQNGAFVGMRLGTGIHTGDRLILSTRSNGLAHNEYDPYFTKLFDGEDWQVTFDCQFCSGACRWNFTKLEYWATGEVPTALDQDDVCSRLDEGKPRDFTLWNDTHLPWGPFGNEFNIPWMKMVGDVHVRIAVLTAAGSPRLDETFSVRVGSGLNKQPAATALLQLDQKQRSERRKVGFLGLLRETFGQTFRRASWGSAEQHDEIEGDTDQSDSSSQGQTSLSARKAMRAELARRKALERRSRAQAQKERNEHKKGVELKSTVSSDVKRLTGSLGTMRLMFQAFYFDKIGTGNLSVVEKHQYCSAMDERGSVVCAIPFGAPVNLKVNMDLQTTLTEGDKLEILVTPKITRFLSAPLHKLFKPTTLEMPACGDKEQARDFDLFQQTYTWVPVKCGTYRLSGDFPPWVTTGADLTQTTVMAPKDMPKWVEKLLPSKVGKMPPFSLSTRVNMKHADGSVFGSFTLEAGLE